MLTTSPVVDNGPVKAATGAVTTALKTAKRGNIHLNLSTALANTHITYADVRTLVEKVKAEAKKETRT